jgi:hypothetical protein
MKFVTCIVGRLDTLLLEFFNISSITFGYLMSVLNISSITFGYLMSVLNISSLTFGCLMSVLNISSLTFGYLMSVLNISSITFGYLMSELISIYFRSIQSSLSLVSAVALLLNETVLYSLLELYISLFNS